VDITATRKARIAEILTSLIGVLADLGYLGWDEEVITGRRKPRGREASPAQRAANRLQAQLRCVGERGNARLKYWKYWPQNCAASREAARPWSRRRWPCTTWSTTRSLPCAPRDPPQSLPIRDTHADCGTVAGRHAKITRDQQKEPGPSLSNQAAPCDNSG
jgi:hypothetical protein